MTCQSSHRNVNNSREATRLVVLSSSGTNEKTKDAQFSYRVSQSQDEDAVSSSSDCENNTTIVRNIPRPNHRLHSRNFTIFLLASSRIRKQYFILLEELAAYSLLANRVAGLLLFTRCNGEHYYLFTIHSGFTLARDTMRTTKSEIHFC
jgi:hypothetical protein